jgi:hypothetical protein
MKKYTYVKKAFQIMLVLFCAFMLGSCYNTKILINQADDVKLATPNEQLNMKIKQKNFYLLYGLVPWENNSPADKIKEYGFTKVRIYTRFGLTDFLLTTLGFGGLLMTTNTTVIEGTQIKEVKELLPESN